MPNRLTRRRLDRHPIYLCVLVALFIDAIIVLLHFRFGGVAHARLAAGTTDLMAFTLGFGTLTCLLAAASGTARFRPNADLRDTYAIQQWGLIPVVVAVGVFAAGILATVPWAENIETTVLLVGIAVGLGLKAWDFRTQAHRLTRELVQEARR